MYIVDVSIVYYSKRYNQQIGKYLKMCKLMIFWHHSRLIPPFLESKSNCNFLNIKMFDTKTCEKHRFLMRKGTKIGIITQRSY